MTAVTHDFFACEQSTEQVDIFVRDGTTPCEVLAEMFVFLLPVAEAEGVGHRPLLMMSTTAISSASRTGSYSGSDRDDIEGQVRGARREAEARISGAGRYPSGEPWCSQSTAARQPRCSDQAHMSIAVA